MHFYENNERHLAELKQLAARYIDIDDHRPIAKLALKSARKACEARGIKIRNATRSEGQGALERVSFDSLFD
jgi:hypothetical protein